MVKYFVLSLIILSYARAVFSQSYEFTTPERLLLSSGAEESMPLLSPDGKLLFFIRSLDDKNSGGVLDGGDIWVSKRPDMGSPWRTASNTEFPWNDTRNNIIVGVNGSGSVYVFNGISNKKAEGIHIVKKVHNTWLAPQLIPLESLPQQSYVGLFVAPTEDVIILSMRGEGGFGEEDLYVSLKDQNGKWSVPKNLGPTVNTKGYEISPFLTADKKRLFFASNGHRGYGSADIFYCERLYNSWETWSVPKNLGDEINSKGFDAYFSMAGDSVAYFASNRAGKFSDLYEVNVKLVWRPSTDEGREYLNAQEVNEWLGGKVQRTFTFEQQSAELTNLQQEHLWYIASKLSEKEDVKIYLRALKPKEDENQELYDKRLSGMVEYLHFAGLDPGRIRTGTETITGGLSYARNKAVVEILFYR